MSYFEAAEQVVKASKQFNKDTNQLFKMFAGKDNFLDKGEIRQMEQFVQKNPKYREAFSQMLDASKNLGDKDGRLTVKELVQLQKKNKEELLKDYL